MIISSMVLRWTTRSDMSEKNTTTTIIHIIKPQYTLGTPVFYSVNLSIHHDEGYYIVYTFKAFACV